jgi:hypothetical protein
VKNGESFAAGGKSSQVGLYAIHAYREETPFWATIILHNGAWIFAVLDDGLYEKSTQGSGV